MLLSLARRITPRSLKIFYHRALGWFAALYYKHPSRKLVVIGVTGTKGKSTTAVLIASVLEALGRRTGYTSTIGFKVGTREWLNDKKMTMLGRFATQKLLAEMVTAGCTHAVIETSSEGIAQSRHRYIAYDVAVFTNLTPEHIESHGSFENYRAAKEKLFSHLAHNYRKTIDGKSIEKIIVANANDEESKRILSFAADKKITFGLDVPADVSTKNIELAANGASFTIADTAFHSPLVGTFNVVNATGAIAAVSALGFSIPATAEAFNTLKPIPGRQEMIDEGQTFDVMVDYAYEPESQRQLYKFIREIHKPVGKIIHVTGSAGGGRDKSRRSALGTIAAENANIVIVTNEDPYDENPQHIIDMVAVGAAAAGKIKDKTLFTILDRRSAIQKALTLASRDDFVLITGKGSEQALCIAKGVKIPWDDRAVVREILNTITSHEKTI